MVLLLVVAMRTPSARVHAVLFAAASLLLAFILLFQFRWADGRPPIGVQRFDAVVW